MDTPGTRPTPAVTPGAPAHRPTPPLGTTSPARPDTAGRAGAPDARRIRPSSRPGSISGIRSPFRTMVNISHKSVTCPMVEQSPSKEKTSRTHSPRTFGKSTPQRSRLRHQRHRGCVTGGWDSVHNPAHHSADHDITTRDTRRRGAPHSSGDRPRTGCIAVGDTGIEPVASSV